MPRVLRVALCQSNPVVGDLAGNVAALKARISEARERGAGVVLFPELSLTGYPPEDLLLKPSFVRDAATALGDLAAGVTGIIACIGAKNVHSPSLARVDPPPASAYTAERPPTQRIPV